MNTITQFDVFLSYKHNRDDQPTVDQLVRILKHYSYTVWFDQEQLPPGRSIVKELEAGLNASSCGIVLIGKAGTGPWQDEEIAALFSRAVRNKIPLIPVLLPGCGQRPELPLMLESRGWVDLSRGFTLEGIEKLAWGITGKKQKLGPLPAQGAPRNQDEYIARRGHLIHKLKAKDSTGRWAYYFVLVEADLEAAFLQAIEGSGNTDLEHYGKVVASCYGEEPSQEVKDYLKERYGFVV
jgi:TIR domain